MSGSQKFSNRPDPSYFRTAGVKIVRCCIFLVNHYWSQKGKTTLSFIQCISLLVNMARPSLIEFPRGQWLCMVLELYLVKKYNTSILKGEYGSFVIGTMRWGGGSGTTLLKL